MKSFRDDLTFFEDKLQRREPFAFSKYADGEWRVLQKRPIDTRRRRGFSWTQADGELHQALMDSFTYRHPTYYVGVGCPCCMGAAVHAEMKAASGQPATNLTWANLWVNGNYRAFAMRILKVFSSYSVHLVSRPPLDRRRLPFVHSLSTEVWIDDDAWRSVDTVVPRLRKVIDDKGPGQLFLFCAGPLGNLLAHQLHAYNQHNTYLDIGSTLDPYLHGNSGFTRRYLRGESPIDKICKWWNE